MKLNLHRLAIAALFIASSAVVGLGARNGVDLGVFALIGEKGGMLASVASRLSSNIRVYCADEESANACREVFDFGEGEDFKAVLDFIREHGKGLLSEKSIGLLERGETNRIARSAMRRDYSGIGLFPKADDPYYFLEDFVSEFTSIAPKNPSEGVLLTATVDSVDKVRPLLELARKDDRISLSGAPFHTLMATERSVAEINLLGAVSVIAILLIGWGLFRSFRFVFPVLIALAFGFLVGAACVFLLPSRPHVLTFLFGTSLLGLGVDYCYHALSERGSGKKITIAFVTTALAFSPLLCSSVAVLNQMAVFTICGLGAIRLMVRKFEGEWAGNVYGHLKLGFSGRTGRLFRALVFLAAVLGVVRISFSNDVKSFHTPDPLMAKGEAAVAKAVGTGLAKFKVVDLEEWQCHNAELKERAFGPMPGKFMTAADLPRMIEALVYRDGDRDMLLLPSKDGLDPAAELSKLFERFASETYKLLGIALAILVGVMFFVFRGRFIYYVGPILLAVAATAGVLGWISWPVNFFQLLCFFVTIGLGIDYSVFHRQEGIVENGSFAVVAASFLTSLIGFGMLAFTSFAITRAMGLTIGVGLFFAYVFSLPERK